MNRRTALASLALGILVGATAACLCPANQKDSSSSLRYGDYVPSDPADTPYDNVTMDLTRAELVLELDVPSTGTHVVLTYELVSAGVW